MSFIDTTLFTNPRLDEYTKRYKEYTEVLKNKQQDGELFKYYHFEYSPNGVKLIDLGRIPNIIVENEPLWQSKTGWNSPSGWKIQIAMETSKDLIDKPSSSPGLKYKIVNLDNQRIESASSVESKYFFDNVVSIMGELNSANNAIEGLSNGFDTFNDSIGSTNIDTLSGKNIGIEWTGYFKPTDLGIYNFTFNCGDGFCLLWIDNTAICEYLPMNAIITTSGGEFNFNAKEDKFYPIRIQFYLSKQSKKITTTELIIKGSNGIPVDTKTCLYNLNGGTYLPKLYFFAFVSEKVEDLRAGKFKCFYFNGKSQADFSRFYDIINQNKFNIASKKYDRDTQSEIYEFGSLPDGTNYTDVVSPGAQRPSVFSLYRFEADIRMGKTFQIDQRGSDDKGKPPYPMRVVSPTIIQPGKSYQELSNFYPDEKNDTGAVYSTPENCKQMCSAKDDCKYYFTYKTGFETKNKCALGQNNELPSFSEIRPDSIKENTATLALRDYTFPKPTCGEQKTIGEFETVENITLYGDSFPFSRYKLIPDIIKSRKNLGICGDARFSKLDDEAQRILFKNADYINRGKTWKEGFSEGFDKNTTGISDTADGIKSNLMNERAYASTQKNIDKNFYDLSQNFIPNYLHVKEIMNNDVNYDFSGNVLLNFRNKPIPTLREQTVIDTNDALFMQNNLYILGILTMLCLLTLAIISARE